MKRNLGPWILFFTFLANFVFGFGLHLYLRTALFDITLHFLGGLGVYLTLYQFVSKDFQKVPRWQFIVLLIGATILVGVVWEFTEYISSTTIGTIGGVELIGDLRDTLEDLFMDILGAVVGSLIYPGLRKRRRTS
ncbi:MAG: hypothetical protein Q7S32_04000 [bacterium]|nr:hypothetical protein [bacterium]